MSPLSRWWPAILWAALIFGFSMQAFSSEHTSRFVIPLLHWLFPRASADTLELIHHLLRKSGHVTEYFVLSLLVLRGIRAGRREAHLAWALAAVALVAGYAALDEVHQSLSPGRGVELSDVLLDTGAGAVAQALAAAVLARGRARSLPSARQEVSPPK